MKRISLFYTLVFFLMAGSLQAQMRVPAFSFTDLEGNAFTNAELDQSKPIMIMLFDPFCDHCDKQASAIAENAEQFKDVQFVFVTLEPEVSYIEDFKNRHFGESGLEHLYFLQDTDVAFEGYFGYTDDVVNIYLFHPDRKNPKYFGEEQTAEVLLKYL